MENLGSVFQDYDPYVNAFIASLLISYASAPIGVFLNLKRMTLMGEAISHSLLPGFALAFMLYGVSYSGLILGGLFAGILVLGLMMGLNRFVTIKEDGVLTIVYLTFSALGLLIVLKSGIKIDLSHILIGNILLIDQTWNLILLISSVLIRFLFGRIQKDLLIILMDPEYAQFLGIPIQRIKSIFYFLVLWILVLCFYSVGTLLALGLLMIPALLAKVAVKSISGQIKFSLVFGIVMSVMGLAASIGLDWPTGPTIILAGGILFILLLFLRPGATQLAAVLLSIIFCFGPSAEASFLTRSQPKDQILISNSYLKLYLNHLVKSRDNVQVETLIPGDQSSHNFQVKPSDIKKIKRAKVFLFIGNGLEDTLKNQVVTLNSEVLAVNLAAPTIHNGRAEVPTATEVHFWLNPDSALDILQSLKSVLAIERPDLKGQLEARFTESKFHILDYTTHIRDKFRIHKGRSVLVSHNSLYFLGNFLGITAHFYIQSFRPSDVVTLKKILKDKKIPILKEYGAVNFLFDSLMNEQQRIYSGEVYGEILPVDFLENKNYLELLKLNMDSVFEVLSKNKTQEGSNRQTPTPAR